jgi:geranylgeranyl diphosphate synthase type II
MKGFKDHINLIENYIGELLKGLNDNPVYDPVKYFLKLPSKRVRPLLTIISSSLYNNDNEYSLPAAISNEIFHNFTLVHDDVMDSSSIRRGNDTVHVKWNLNQAILSGDIMQILAYKCLESYDSKTQKKLIKAFNDTAIKVCEGQQLDIEFESQNNLKFDDYIQMISYKTAVLLASSLKMGGIINNASETDLKSLYKIGLNMGCAFQIQDDYLDLFGDQNIIGKKIGGDIIKNKKTVMYHLYKENSSIEDSNILDEIYNDSNIQNDQKVSNIKKLFVQNEIDLKTRELVKKYTSKTDEYINALMIDTSKKQYLIDISNKLLSRDF